MPKHSRDDGTCSRLETHDVWTSSRAARVLSTAPAAARIFSPPTESPHPAFVASRRARRARVSFSPRRLPFERAHYEPRADPRDARRPSPPERLSPPRRADRDAALFPRDGIQKRKTKSALSLDAFSRAKRSTYDKRVVLEKRRNLAAAKVNKYRKIEKRLGKSVEVTDAFDPEKYAARLDALERDLPRDDGFGRGRRGRRVSTTDFSHDANHQREGSTVVPARRPSKKDAANDDAESDSDGAFRDNVVFPANEDADADAEEEKKKETTAKDERRDPNQSKPVSNKGWNKAVKEGLKKNARREEKEREMAALREKWAAENAAKRAFFERRDATRDKFRKKNARGQPVMRHRVDKILEQLQKDA